MPFPSRFGVFVLPQLGIVVISGRFILRAPASSYAMKLTSTDPATTCWRIRFAGEKLGHEMAPKKDTVVIKNGVKYTQMLHV